MTVETFLLLCLLCVYVHGGHLYLTLIYVYNENLNESTLSFWRGMKIYILFAIRYQYILVLRVQTKGFSFVRKCIFNRWTLWTLPGFISLERDIRKCSPEAIWGSGNGLRRPLGFDSVGRGSTQPFSPVLGVQPPGFGRRPNMATTSGDGKCWQEGKIGTRSSCSVIRFGRVWERSLLRCALTTGGSWEDLYGEFLFSNQTESMEEAKRFVIQFGREILFFNIFSESHAETCSPGVCSLFMLSVWSSVLHAHICFNSIGAKILWPG